MADVAHASLTGSQLHEPKGVATATLGTVYVANGSGSGTWANVGTSSFTGAIADFVTPIVQDGWLELDGSTISTTTYSALYNVMTIQMTGSRTNASPIITGLSSTTNMRVGYYVFGTGITSGATILSVDSANQITISIAAGSSGSATVLVSPWLLNTGTIKLPDVSTAGRYRRSRTASTAVGQLQADQNQAHTHGVSGNSGANNVDHTHSYSGTTSLQSASHTHPIYTPSGSTGQITAGSLLGINNTTTASSGESVNHNHTFSGTTATNSVSHLHAISLTSASQGGTEARPLSIVVMTCVKT